MGKMHYAKLKRAVLHHGDQPDGPSHPYREPGDELHHVGVGADDPALPSA